MAILEMQKLSVYALKQHRKEVLEFLQRTGAMELILSDSEEYQTMDTLVRDPEIQAKRALLKNRR